MQVPPPPPGFSGSSAPAFAPLPAGWTEHAAPTGQPYFFHAPSGTSTYVRPGHEGVGASGSVPPPPPPGFPEANNAVAPEAPAKKKKKEKPIEKLPIEGTPWLRVTTNEGNVFFTNTETKASVWTVPEEIKEQVELSQARQKNGHAGNPAADAEAARLIQEKEAEMQLLREELEKEREASRKRKLEEDEQEASHAKEEAQSAKRARASVQVEDDDAQEQQDDNVEQEDMQEEEQEEELEDWQKDELQAKAELEAELETPAPAAEQTDYSSEEAIALFKTMLAEKDINPMKPWDMELPKFINDPRYKSVKQLRERRDLFDEHCKLKIRENRAKKNAAGQAKADPASAYRALLVAEVTSTRAHWEDFRKKHKKDSRFRDFGRDDRERERVFRNWLRELGEIKRADAQKAEEKFLDMLKEQDIPMDGARWSDVKGKIASDPRYSLVASSSQREEVFKRYLEDRKAAPAIPAVDPQEAKRIAAEERKTRQAASLKEREDKVRKDREALERAAGRSRAEAGREESEREYKNLLIDAVRDHEAKWNDVLPSLEKDRRYTSSNLSIQNKRRLFDEHLDEIYNKRITVLETLFSSHAPKLQSTFDDVYAQISSNPNVTRLNMSESRIQRLFDEWSRRRYAQARKDFESLLNESSFVDYWMKLKQEHGSKEFEKTKELLGNEGEGGDEGEVNAEDGVDIRAMAAQIDMKELHSVLKHDKRYAIFDYEPEARETWLREHVEKLAPPKQTVHQR